MEKRLLEEIENAIDGVLDVAYELPQPSRNSDDMTLIRNLAVKRIYEVATRTQRAGGAATRGVTSERKAQTSADNGRLGGRPTTYYVQFEEKGHFLNDWWTVHECNSLTEAELWVRVLKKMMRKAARCITKTELRNEGASPALYAAAVDLQDLGTYPELYATVESISDRVRLLDSGAQVQ